MEPRDKWGAAEARATEADAAEREQQAAPHAAPSPVVRENETDAAAAAALAVLATAPSRGDQIDALQRFWFADPRLRLLQTAEVAMAEAETILAQLAKVKTAPAQREILKRARRERLAVAAFDVAVAELVMSGPSVRLLEKVVGRVGTGSDAVASALDALEEGCFLSSAQASKILAAAGHLPEATRHDVWHVVCARVLDRWNLDERDHSVVACYYGWDGPYVVRLLREVVERRRQDEGAPLPDGDESWDAYELRHPETIEPRWLQNRVLAHMGRGGDEARSRSAGVRRIATQLVAKTLHAGSSEVCAVCLEDCENGTQLWTCTACHKRLHSTCWKGWCRQQANANAERATCPYCRA